MGTGGGGDEEGPGAVELDGTSFFFTILTLGLDSLDAAGRGGSLKLKLGVNRECLTSNSNVPSLTLELMIL